MIDTVLMYCILFLFFLYFARDRNVSIVGSLHYIDAIFDKNKTINIIFGQTKKKFNEIFQVLLISIYLV